jgi:hypothetical protein
MSLWFAGVQKTEIGKCRAETNPSASRAAMAPISALRSAFSASSFSAASALAAFFSRFAR